MNISQNIKDKCKEMNDSLFHLKSLFHSKNIAVVGLKVDDITCLLEQISLFMEYTVHVTLYSTNMACKSLQIDENYLNGHAINNKSDKCLNASRNTIIADIINEMDPKLYIKKYGILDHFNEFISPKKFETQSFYKNQYILDNLDLSTLGNHSFNSISNNCYLFPKANEISSKKINSFKETVLMYSRNPKEHVSQKKMSEFGKQTNPKIDKKSMPITTSNEHSDEGSKSNNISEPSPHVSMADDIEDMSQNNVSQSPKKSISFYHNLPKISKVPSNYRKHKTTIGRLFSTDSELGDDEKPKQSKQVYQKEYECPICPKRYSSIKAKRYHIRNKHKENSARQTRKFIY